MNVILELEDYDPTKGTTINVGDEIGILVWPDKNEANCEIRSTAKIRRIFAGNIGTYTSGDVTLEPDMCYNKEKGGA